MPQRGPPQLPGKGGAADACETGARARQGGPLTAEHDRPVVVDKHRGVVTAREERVAKCVLKWPCGAQGRRDASAGRVVGRGRARAHARVEHRVQLRVRVKDDLLRPCIRPPRLVGQSNCSIASRVTEKRPRLAPSGTSSTHRRFPRPASSPSRPKRSSCSLSSAAKVGVESGSQRYGNARRQRAHQPARLRIRVVARVHEDSIANHERSWICTEALREDFEVREHRDCGAGNQEPAHILCVRNLNTPKSGSPGQVQVR